MFKSKKFLIIILSFILIFSLSACSKDKVEDTKEKKNITETSLETKYPLTIKDSYNRQITLDKEPEKIISIAPNITETIYAIDKSNKLIGRTDFCNYPAEVKNISSIGSLQNPSIEKIVDLKPDLVIASTHFKKDVLKKLEDLGVKVLVLYGEENFEGAYDTIEKMGKVLNANNKAKEIVVNMKKKVSDVETKVSGKTPPSVYYVIGFGKSGDYTAGKDTFIDKMITMAGGKNVAKDAVGWKYSIEKLLEKNPEIMICSKYFNVKEDLKKANGYKDLDAIKKGKLFEIDNNMLDRQGPRLADGLEQLAKILHPEAFK
ncbi:iron complex transport system substrate-binding protein [Clostridium tetanomorphum]|uniref:ABC transporter substrate-binding protein n=1 Tax=Clostridium tetanomorphum TaxID=1553 RepID=A0A923E794_CLOTT|nr:ABC transporter substrate-binding protein [Clostridium tetanomorphum]KAJ51826.1 iron(III) dicitrate-binding periplasmic protein [Clostridium tetanomorphum DSM 665]MBC2397708.1 ABC transporter substrate-binding protein [Clostridium tetanomorphum]MBP1865063.1 iron complex transport system substrate-binding protein [Clostridium tetanomorphum]NRS83339.1 iron complex transport system substrate-binding protein [Clostridium tetanomorphum]NRZ96539.1 iron complex transport system substrate-binding p